MPLQATAGAATYDAFGGGVTVANYIEDVFQTWLYTGSSSSLTITNGIDLSTKGGMIWLKNRVAAAYNNNYVMDTARGNSRIITNLTNAANTGSLSSFNTDGFTLLGGGQEGNESGVNTVSWTFRKQPKFFDVVTYTGTGSAQTIAHNLGSVPGCIIVKRTDTTSPWAVAHRGTSNYSSGTDGLNLNTTDAVYSGTVGGWWNSTGPTSTQFSVGTYSETNASGGTYVAYLFAHDAGGFGASGTDNVISCGSLTTDGSGNASLMNLGWEPQWILFKRSNGIGNWAIIDNMRGMPVATAGTASLNPNLSNAEDPVGYATTISATGNQFYPTTLASSSTYIYIAIRRGPMKTPTSGTSVFNAIARAGTSAAATVTGVGFPPDLLMTKIRDSTVGTNWSDRLRGPNQNLDSSSTNAEATSANRVTALGQDGFSLGTASEVNVSGFTYINWNFRRAPGFFDEVCYTGTGAALQDITHNLTTTPELIIVKCRSSSYIWQTYSAATGATKYLTLNTTDAAITASNAWFDTSPGATTFRVGGSANANQASTTYVAYLFATVAGVSKVGSYTGTGTTLQVNCGFTAGARFVLIKRTDSTGDWYVWDSARGIVAGNDPYLLLNSTAAEVTSTDYVDTYSAGFEISSTAPAAINANGGTFIFLAIA